MPYAARLDRHEKIDLADYTPDKTRGIDHDAGRAEAEKLGARLGELQELLYAASLSSVLVVLQGMDTSGKDGTIKHVFDAVNPQGVEVAAFKQPTPEELAHDFLWRVHKRAPARGHMTIFNRSHYEDVLTVRVHNLVPKAVWEKRYEQINRFEALLAASGTIVVKFFLHISKSEQKERLLAREDDPAKGYKLSAADWRERQYWDEYIAAYEDALGKTATKDAPWYVVPADHKWYRDLAIAEVLVKTLDEYRGDWTKRLHEISAQARKELDETRSKKSKDKE